MTSKAFWALRAAGKYSEARQLLLTKMAGPAPCPEALYEAAYCMEHGELGWTQLPRACILWYTTAADLGHEASRVLACLTDLSRAEPSLQSLFCPYARALYYEFIALERDEAQPYYLQAAERGIVHAMRHCGQEWTQRGADMGDILAIASVVMDIHEPDNLALFKRAAFQGDIDACKAVIGAFAGVTTNHDGQEFSDGWHIGWQDGVRAVLCCPGRELQETIVRARIWGTGMYGTRGTHHWQEVYHYSVSPRVRCKCPLLGNNKPCLCDPVELEAIRSTSKNLLRDLDYVKKRIHEPSKQAALLLYTLAWRRYNVPKDVARILGCLVLGSRREHADLWSDVFQVQQPVQFRVIQ